MAEYRAAVPGTLAQYGGRFLVRGGATELVEGEPEPKRIRHSRIRRCRRGQALVPLAGVPEDIAGPARQCELPRLYRRGRLTGPTQQRYALDRRSARRGCRRKMRPRCRAARLPEPSTEKKPVKSRTGPIKRPAQEPVRPRRRRFGGGRRRPAPLRRSGRFASIPAELGPEQRRDFGQQQDEAPSRPPCAPADPRAGGLRESSAACRKLRHQQQSGSQRGNRQSTPVSRAADGRSGTTPHRRRRRASPAARLPIQPPFRRRDRIGQAEKPASAAAPARQPRGAAAAGKPGPLPRSPKNQQTGPEVSGQPE